MKKSLLALAVLGAFAGVASAQSSVTLSGTVDLAGRYVKNDGQNRRVSLANSGLNSSQLVFSGIEDLGGGLKAGFVLNSGLGTDTGTASGGGKFWNRRATLSLLGGFGEVRLGRDYTPTFWNTTIFDAFGTVGIADSGRIGQLLSGTFARADNSIGYFLPSNIGGIYGQVMVAASEGGAAQVPAGNPGRYIGGRVGFAAGPFNIAAAAAHQRIDGLPGIPNHKTYNVGGSYDLGFLKLMGFYVRDELAFTGSDLQEDRVNASVVVPLGQGEIHASYNHGKLKRSNAPTFKNTNKMYAVGYVYNLSKRTAVYTTVARLDNGSRSRNTTDGGAGSSAGPLPTLGGNSTGAEFGVRHFF